MDWRFIVIGISLITHTLEKNLIEFLSLLVFANETGGFPYVVTRLSLNCSAVVSHSFCPEFLTNNKSQIQANAIHVCIHHFRLFWTFGMFRWKKRLADLLRPVSQQRVLVVWCLATMVPSHALVLCFSHTYKMRGILQAGFWILIFLQFHWSVGFIFNVLFSPARFRHH